jgi:hypothetical protein
LLVTVIGVNFAQSANAKSAKYTWSITNAAPWPVFQYDVPTSTGGMPQPWVSPSTISANGGITSGYVIVPSSVSAGASGTSYIGTTAGAPAPYYNHEYECAFTITAGQISADGAICTAPTPSQATTYGLSSIKPACTIQNVQKNADCDYTVFFTFGYN